MVKKLRNRQIEEDAEVSAETQEELLLRQQRITQVRLRQFLKKKFSKKVYIGEEKFKKFKGHLRDGSLNKIVNETSFECAICLELMVRPTMRLCGHMFCLKCIESNSAYNNRCCLCRKDQENLPFVNNPISQKIIYKFLLPTSESFITYLCRTTDTEEWIKRRRLIYIRQNQIIDFQDRFNTWRRGVVVQVIPKKKKLMARIKVNLEGIDLFEVIQATSHRLAPYTFFTKKRYLEEFSPVIPEHNPADRDLECLQYRITRQVSQDDIWGFENREEGNGMEDFLNIPLSENDEGIDQILMMFDLQVDHSRHLLS